MKNPINFKQPLLNKNNITGVILAGGRATRMGGQDKGLIQFNGKCLVEHIVALLRPQVGKLIISANRNQARYAELCSCPVLADNFGDYAGPLAGIATTLAYAQSDYVLFVPCDSPRLNPQLAERLYTFMLQVNADISVANDGKRIHPVFSVWKRRLLADLLIFLEVGNRSVHRFFTRHSLALTDFSDATFLNINTFEEHTALNIET